MTSISRAFALALLGTALVAMPAFAQTKTKTQAEAEHKAGEPGKTATEQPGGQKGDTQPSGMEPPHENTGPTGDRTVHAPIGAGPGTMPAKFDEKVAAQDRIAIMARPVPLSDEQRRRVYDTIMSNASIPVTPTEARPATILPNAVEMSDLPSGMADEIPAVRGYKFVKLQDKVLLVAPANRVVVGEVSR
jgi:hypothetical protein